MLGVLLSINANSSVICTSSPTLDEDVSGAAVTLDSITSVLDPDDPKTELLSRSYGATGCVGVFERENDDQGGISDPDPNIGQLNDGMLNGEGDLFDGMEFISEDDLQDLDGDETFDDPGWIHLAEYMTYENSPSTIDYSDIGPSYLSDNVLDIGSLLNISLTCNVGDIDDGCTDLDWTIATDPSIIEQVQALLGPATFDHLAFSIKSGNDFAVYDFDFNKIFAEEPDVDFLTPYILSGSLNTRDFPNPNANAYHAISHMNIWARDPFESVRVSEPSTLSLFALMLILLGLKVKRTRVW